MKYGDKVEFIRQGGNSRNGKLPNKLITVFFVRWEIDTKSVFSYIYSKEEPRHVYEALTSSVVLVNGKPYK